jgi:hypothetical protein
MTNEYLYQPGDEVPVDVLADSNGDVAREGQGVSLTGEGESLTQVELVETEADRCVGVITTEPSGLEDPEALESDFAAGDSVGEATLALWHPVIWMPVDDGYTPSVADYVRVGDGGDVEAYTGPTATGLGGAVTNDLGVDGSGSLETDGANDIDLNFTEDAFPFGTVFTTIAREWGVQGKVAVMKGVL